MLETRLRSLVAERDDALQSISSAQSPSKEFREAALKEKLMKETAKRDNEIGDMKLELDALGNENNKLKKRINDISFCLCKTRKQVTDKEQYVDELRSELKISQDKVQNLQEQCNELHSFFVESRSCGDRDVSFIDYSFASASNIINSTEYDCESLSESVTDLKLKEAQKKIETLEEKLAKSEQDNESLAIRLKELSTLGQQRSTRPSEGRFRTIMNAGKFFSFI